MSDPKTCFRYLSVIRARWLAKPNRDEQPGYQMQSYLPQYIGFDGLTADFLQKVTQFGYTALFSMAVPWLPLLGLCVNMLEVNKSFSQFLFSCGLTPSNCAECTKGLYPAKQIQSASGTIFKELCRFWRFYQTCFCAASPSAEVLNTV